MGSWQEWSIAHARAPVANGQLVDVLYEGEDLYVALPAEQVEWFSLRHRVVLWREAEVTAEGE